MRLKKSKITIIILVIALSGVAFKYSAIAGLFSQPTKAKGLVGHWSLSQDEEVMGSEIIVNGGMEGTYSSGLVPNWTEYDGSSEGTPSEETSSPHSGNSAQKYVTIDYGPRIYQTLSLVVGKRYVANVWVKVDSGTVGVYVRDEIADGTVYGYTGNITNSEASDWTQYSFYFTPADTTPDIYFNAENAATFYFDDVSVKEISAADLTPNANNGAIYGATYTTDRNGQANNAMSFDGTDDYIYVSGSSARPDAGTYAAWVKYDGSGSFAPLFGFTNSTVNGLYLKYTAAQTKPIIILNSSDYRYFQEGDLWDGNWHHVVFILTGSGQEDINDAKFYVDGNEMNSVATTSNNAPLSKSWLTIGSAHSNYADAVIADARIYDRALTQEEINELYQGYKPSIIAGAKQKGLVGRWSLGDEDEVMGSELVSNGSFDDTSAWVKGGGDTPITITDGEAVLYSGDSIYQQITTTIGKTYRFSLEAYESGNVGIWFRAVSSNWADNPILYYSPYTTSIKTKYEVYFTATDTRTWIQIKEKQGLDGYLYFDNVSLREVHAADLTPNQNNGVIYGPSYTTDRNGQSNQAMSFDGVDDEIYIGDSDELDFNGSEAFSISAWVLSDSMPTNTGGNDAIVSKWESVTPLRAYTLYLSNDDDDSTGYFGVTVYDESANQGLPTLATSDSVSENTWYYVIATFNGGTAGAAGDLNLYVDGVLAASNTANASFLGLEDLAVDAVIGGHDSTETSSLNDNFDGSISDVRIYNRALTAAEVSELYNSNKPVVKVGALQKGLVGHWTMDEKDGKSDTVIGDRTINANDGTLTNMTFSANATTDRNGQTRALDFGGVDDYISIANTSYPSTYSDPYTIALWVYVPSSATWTNGMYGNIVVRGSFAGSVGFVRDYSVENRIRAWIRSAGGSLTTYTSITRDIWYYMVVVYDGNQNIYIYKNGVLSNSNSGTVSGSHDANSWEVGGNSSIVEGSAGNFYEGKMQDLRIYNRALSATEVKMLYEQY